MSKKATYGTVFLFTLIYVLSFVDRQIVAVLGVQIRDALQLNNLQIGLLYGPAFSFIYAIAGIPMGRLADRTSRKLMICLGLFIWSLMTVFSGFAASFLFLVTARLFVGLSQAMLSPAVYSYLADTFSPNKRATIFSFYSGGIFIGVGLSFLIGGSISLAYDWRMAMIAVGVPGVVIAPVTWWFLKEPDRPFSKKGTENNALSEIRDLLKKKTVRWHLLGFSCLACTGYTILAFVGNVFNDVYSEPGLIPNFGWFMMGVAGTVIISGRVADLLARDKPEYRFWMGIVAALGGLPLYIFGLFQPDATTAFICVGIGVLISSSYNGVAAALLQYFVRSDQRALAGGLYLFVISIAGFGLGPPVTGWLIDSVYTGTYAVSYALMTVMIVCSSIATVSFIQAMKSYQHDALNT
ncbi:spinster family MFS transporter [Rhodohalobacter sp. 614A]|uniref:spinster family MFS transporter n=1 Tax=Rhodohalobacter sp. 614A TaxID=2908649 RepID=UPI001F15F7CE|nr:MFS transporter [Rhodohalobacter sp. 614A]